ncbi:MAG: hypothetical protein J6N72_08385 [Psychrobacter sp.]|nr:hypothetical protein [Psychrobacter sp.]
MSNASNYCTEYLEDTIGSTDEDVALVMDNINHVQTSVKFRIPDNGVIMDVIKGIDLSSEAIQTVMPAYVERIVLPYNDVALEFIMKGDLEDVGKDTVMIILASNMGEGGVYFDLILRTRHMGISRWVDVRTRGVISTDFSVMANLPLGDDDDITVEESSVLIHAAYILLSFIAALQCSNVEEYDQITDIKLNKSRIKKGKLSFFDYKILTVNTNKNINKEQSGINNNTSHSNVMNLRKGHINLSESENIWVNSDVRSKNYRILK